MVDALIRVLLLEDDEDDFIVARDLLESIERVKFQLDWAPSFEDGFELLADGEHDVCLVDYRLGSHDGVTFIEAARERGFDIPFILLTGQEDHEVDLRAMEAGASDFLTKAEITPRVLERSIRYSIQQKRGELQRAEIIRAEAARKEAEAANRAKDEFLAILAHELRTPLNAVLGWAQLLSMGNLDEDTQAQAVMAIERNAKAQAQLIEDLLDVSRIISGKVRLERHAVSLTAVIEAALESVRPAANTRQVALHFDATEPDVIVHGDETRLQQVVWNLLSNGIKFTPAGGSVSVELIGEPREARIVVRDTGRGIDPQFLPYIFDRFRQSDQPGASRNDRGLGLGLSIVRHLTELHGGHVSVQSNGAGSGTTFELVFPRLTDASNVDTTSLSEVDSSDCHRPASRMLAGMRVLVVDDEADSRLFLAKSLALCGAEVEMAACAAEAMRLYDRKRPSVLISDIAMPEEDGHSLLRRLRAHALKEGHDLLAVAVTAHASAADRARSLESGFVEHIAKPVDTAHLVSVIADLYMNQRAGSPR